MARSYKSQPRPLLAQRRLAAPFRLYATLALAECARQIGRADARARGRMGHQYDFAMPLIAGSAGEVIIFDELTAY